MLVRGDGSLRGGEGVARRRHPLPPLAYARGYDWTQIDAMTGSRERERVDAVRKSKLPRLAPEYYRGRAFVHWTLTLEHRTTGWLTPAFHQQWRLLLLHACHRYSLVCPAYVLMPDHMHLLWLGLDETCSDQRVAIGFLRQQLRAYLAPADWQRQTFDHVLREPERERGAFQTVAHYILENPVRAGLVARWQDFAFTGCCVAGYPDLNVGQDDYWELFWRLYHRLAERTLSTRSRSRLRLGADCRAGG